MTLDDIKSLISEKEESTYRLGYVEECFRSGDSWSDCDRIDGWISELLDDLLKGRGDLTLDILYDLIDEGIFFDGRSCCDTLYLVYIPLADAELML